MKKINNLKTKKLNNEFTNKINKFNAYYELGKLFFKNFIRDFGGPFFTFGLPVFFLIIFYYIFKSSTTVNSHDIIGGYILLASISCGFNFLSQRISEWKESVFLKRLNVTPLKKVEFLLVIAFFYSIICIIGTIWMFMWTIIINHKYQFENWKKWSNFGYIILGIIFTIFAAVSLAIFVGGMAKSSSSAQGIVLLIYFPSVFLTGIVIPIQAFGGNDIINYVSMILPFKYSVAIYQYGWWYKLNPSDSLYDIYFAWKSTGFTHLWQPLIGSIFYPIILLGISIKTFKWENI